MRCIICAIAKQENQYIYEWAKHHLDIGFAHIHIYDNNEIDGEFIRDVFIGTEIESNITIHDVRGLTCMQLEVYQRCYDNEDFDWCAFIDIDEFITFVSPNMHINEFLCDKNQFEAIHLNWLCYGDDEQISLNGRLVKSITHPIKPIDFKSQYVLIPENAHIKSILRKGKHIVWNAPGVILDWANPHTPANLTRVCNELGEKIVNAPWTKINHNVCYIAHYITKTISEYGVKVQRKAADNNNYYHSYSRFFYYNKLTFRKLVTIKQISKNTRISSILMDILKWKIISHSTYLSRLSKKYKRKIKEEFRIKNMIGI